MNMPGNNQTLSGEEVFLRGLFELVTGSTQYHISSTFGREQPLQSFAFSFFIHHIYETFQYLVFDNLQWWYDKGFLHKSKDAIRVKINGSNMFTTCAFIDCNCLGNIHVHVYYLYHHHHHHHHHLHYIYLYTCIYIYTA
jgi:hypothetical protein